VDGFVNFVDSVEMNGEVASARETAAVAAWSLLVTGIGACHHTHIVSYIYISIGNIFLNSTYYMFIVYIIYIYRKI